MTEWKHQTFKFSISLQDGFKEKLESPTQEEAPRKINATRKAVQVQKGNYGKKATKQHKRVFSFGHKTLRQSNLSFVATPQQPKKKKIEKKKGKDLSMTSGVRGETSMDFKDF